MTTAEPFTPADAQWWAETSNADVLDYCIYDDPGPPLGDPDRPTIDPESSALAYQLRRYAARLEPDGKGTRDLMVRAAERMHQMVRWLEEAEVKLTR